MRATKHSTRRLSSGGRHQRGAALILTVIVIMVLTTLGMAMVAFTTTEERTASTYRDALQTRMLAEAGVRVVQMMFANPDDRSLVPVFHSGSSSGAAWDYYGTTESTTETHLNAIGIWRAARPLMTPARYTGPSNRMFHGPFKTSWAQSFGGSYTGPTSDVYDVKLNCTNPADPTSVVTSANCWLDAKINSLLLASSDLNLQSGKITDISFYGPPMDDGKAYGISTVRVTAVKTDAQGAVISRETIEALIGDNNLAPAILGNGDVEINNFNACGSGCEQIHANGDITIGNGDVTGGDPSVSATGTITGGPADGRPNQAAVTPPQINPWDIEYKPTGSALNKYYLLAARQLDAVWTDGDGGNNPAAYLCGFSICQDYNLEYDTAGVVKTARSAAGTAYLYRWNTAADEWSYVDSKTNGQTFTIGSGSNETLFITVSTANDTTVTGSDDTAAVPFNKDRVPQTTFSMSGPLKPDNDSDDAQLVTLLVDGRFHADGSIGQPNVWKASIIAAGSIEFTGATEIRPAMANRTLLITGRDLNISSSSWNNNFHNLCNGGTAPDPTSEEANASSIYAAHEQMLFQGSVSTTGILIGENRVNHDPTVDQTQPAIQMDAQTDHSYLCGLPDWPWSRPTKPTILSMKSATN